MEKIKDALFLAFIFYATSPFWFLVWPLILIDMADKKLRNQGYYEDLYGY